jgi:hypothetical protein
MPRMAHPGQESTSRAVGGALHVTVALEPGTRGRIVEARSNGSYGAST